MDSNFDRVVKHLRENPDREIPKETETQAAIDDLAQRPESLRRIGIKVELSPYMLSLLALPKV